MGDQAAWSLPISLGERRPSADRPVCLASQEGRWATSPGSNDLLFLSITEERLTRVSGSKETSPEHPGLELACPRGMVSSLTSRFVVVGRWITVFHGTGRSRFPDSSAPVTPSMRYAGIP